MDVNKFPFCKFSEITITPAKSAKIPAPKSKFNKFNPLSVLGSRHSFYDTSLALHRKLS